MSDENVAATADVAEATAPAEKTPDLSTLYAAVGTPNGKWRLVTVRPSEHGKDYESVLRFFADQKSPARLFNATGILSAAEVTVRVLKNGAESEGVKYIGFIDPLIYEGPKL